MKEITVQELKQMMDSGEDFQLIDVRESYEYEEANINGELIPLGEIMSNADKISREKKVIMQCRSGARSATAVRQLEAAHGFDNLYNLRGGILAYINEIDSSIVD